jgi:hypothetical protein
MMSWFKPARSGALSQGQDVIADLDAIVLEPVQFKLHGKLHEIAPVTTESFLRYTNALGKLMELKDKNQITPDELVEGYFGLISSVCGTVTKQDIDDMTQGQVAALFQLVMDSVTGKAQAEVHKQELGEKKNLKIMPLSSISN